MIDRIRKWFTGAGTATASAELFSLGDRMIYRYSNGKDVVAADPIRLYKRVMDVGAELSVDIKIANSPMKEAKDAHQKMLEKIRAVFDVRPLEEGGLTELETVELFDHFMIYVQLVKKNGSQTPTASTGTSTTTPTSTTGGPGDSLATTYTSGSGSTEPVPGSDTPGPSPSGPASPSGPSSPA